MGKRNETILGFWLGEKVITVVESRVSEKQVIVQKSAQASLPAGYLQQGQIVNFDHLLGFMSEIVREIKPQTQFVSMNLPPGSYIIKHMPLDSMYISADKELIAWEMRHQLLSDPNDYFYSEYSVNGRAYFVAALKSIVKQRMELLKGVGLVPIALEPSAVILYNFFMFSNRMISSYGSVLFLELSTPYSSLSLYADGVFYPGSGFVTDANIIHTASKPGNRPKELEKFTEDLKAEFEMLFKNIGFGYEGRSIDNLVISGCHPDSIVAMEIENIFGTNIYLSAVHAKNKHIKLKGKHNNLNMTELASAIGLSLRMPND